jgi:hypothetical protein
MGRRDEFEGGQNMAPYGDFKPAAVDIDLSDPKISDHPHRGQLGAFHDPNAGMSSTCLEPGCGKARSQHKTIHLPPTREGYDAALKMVEGAKTERREAKGVAARQSDQDAKAKASPYGLGGNKALRKHLAEKHELEPEDAAEMERPHHYHRQWHTMGEYNPDGHAH